ncbi:hypothetical protein RB614_26500 [Phytohabitans sp. ZYX-F-186]|uniref:Resolvase/invertase-type recombinase catalytic domain-containing protein n=1 Tax=Phytohabitans maris TaxID=3071409 RepID=A0ABU0ZM13_9ACTN|nr:hypothetical protein [Phytohabitans sp. ZYX-F-186]MDQ7908083.1 hypothetical protein [Phytohabitans sp. ZYX-F-186]
MPTVTFVDETLAGARSDGWELEIFEERLRLDELIRRRIYQEVAEHNARPAGDFRGLVRPAGGPSAPRRVEWEAQYERALEAFQRNGFVVLVGDRQVTELDHEVELSARTEVTFLKLVPLVGG